jgi:hypothetical protein
MSARLLLAAAVFLALSPYAAAQSGTFVNFEGREVSAIIPAGYPECWPDAFAIHGFYTRLDGKPCKAAPPANRYINIQWNGDIEWITSALDSFKGRACSGGGAWGNQEWAGAIDGFQTAICRIDKPDGSIEMTFSAYAEWRLGARRSIYSVYFGTTRERFEQDFAVLKQFLCSVDILDTGSGSSLCASRLS